MVSEEFALDNNELEPRFNNTIEDLNKLLTSYGLSSNQSKVYLYLSKIGIKTASEISKALKIPRTETYHLLNSLEQKGIVYNICGKPTRFRATDMDKAVDTLIKNEKNKIDELEQKKKNILYLWNTCQ